MTNKNLLAAALFLVVAAISFVAVSQVLNTDDDRVPEVTNVTAETIAPGGELDVAGKNLDVVSAVLLSKGLEAPINALHTPVNQSRLVVRIPDSAKPNTYVLELKTFNGDVIGTDRTIVVKAGSVTTSPPTQPTRAATTVAPSATRSAGTPTPRATAQTGGVKQGVLLLRYTGDVQVGRGLQKSDFMPGTVVHVLPGQQISDEFLESEVGTSSGKTYLGKTGISFDPKNPLIAGQTFTVKEVEPHIAFTEPFPENMRNSWNSYFTFEVEVSPPE